MIFPLSLFIFICHVAFGAQKIHHTSTPIDTLLVSGDTIFVASVDQIQAIGVKNLTQRENLTIGPVADSPWCNADGKSCLKDHRPVLTHVHTKILHPLPNSQLLICTSVKLGSCSTYSTKLSLISISSTPVAANSANASTVSLILPDTNRLIVAASPTADSPYRDPFPAVSMRSLPGLYVENAGDLEGEAAVFLRAAWRSSMKYIYTFSYEHFIFIVGSMTQRNGQATTRLIRFCRNDTKFVSYSEIELQCRGEDNTNYPQITAVVQNGDKLVAAFSNPLNTRKSSICVFSMPRIKLTFWYNVDRCRSGTDSIKLSHIGRDTKCVNKAHIPLDEDSCELGVGGSIELVEMSTKDIYANITSLMSIDKKALFVGTTTAQIIMLKWGDSESQTLEEYGRRDLGDRRTGSEVLAIHRYQDLFIAQMPYGIVVDEISTCSHLNSCAECLLSPDPLCQWCHPTQSCTIGSKCGVGVSQVCPSISGIPKPSAMSVNTTGPVVFEIENLPAPHGFTYRCRFGPHYTKAVWTSSGITCASKNHEHAENLELSLQTSLSEKNIVTTNFTIFDCSKFQTCSLCSTSQFNCQWCPANHKCTANSNCPTKSTDKCVKLLPITIPIALGSKQKITLSGENLGTLDRSQNYTCLLQIAGHNLTSRAKISDSNVKCSEINLSSDSENLKSSDLMVPMILKSSKNIIDITNISLYSCSNMASDCSSCLSLSPNLNCGWCNSKCSHDCAPSKKVHVCDPPQITKIEPDSGPVEGGTLIRIYGKDLGMSVEDVRGKVYVAGSRCDVIDYQISNMIACRVDKGTASGPVKVSVGRVAMATAESTQYYSFVKIAIFSAYPLFGPLSGGTKITLYGQHLEVGSEIRITIGNLPCKVLDRNSTSTISCITPPGNIVGKSSRVVVSIDESNVILDQMFEYRPDPTISNIYPLEMFKAGGRVLQVYGQNLDVSQVAKIYLLNSFNPPFAIASELRQCQVLNSTLMNCPAPRVHENSNWRADYTKLPVGFIMDNVTSVQNLGRRLQMSVKPNPQLSPFKGILYHQGEQPLILNGHNLNLAAEPADFKIYIGSERCYVTLVDIKQLVCSGPIKQPKPTDEKGQPITGELPPVTVIIGTIRTELGLIEYSNQNNTHRLTWMIIGLLLFIILLLGMMCAIWKRRRNEKEKEYKKIQLQMENLENNVRKECKQAFAELQTNLIMSPAKNSRATPEFMHFPHFVENLLWSDSTLTSAPSLTRTLPVTLAQFHALLSFKNFIFSIVEAAETDVSISATERSMLASLLISVLLRNFGYCTEIVLDLLRIHIARAVQNKKSELLFRNSESVVEKMVAKWLSICLYSHITPQMNSFYYLYKALQYQTEKGPVDAVTGDARYTINESRLLRETVESSTMIVLVSASDCTANEEVFEVEVHACDAICQLKQKVAAVVYRDTPYSQRPRISQFDLQLKNGVKLQEVLNDRTSKGPQKLQTLSDYNVIQGTWMQLIPALYTASSYRNSLADSGQSSWSSLDRVSPIYSSSKYYHLSNPNTSQTLKKSSQNIPKSIPEVYLTRLLTSKGTVQTYVEDFLESVLYFNDADFPPILKHFFDILDREAAMNSVSENICQQWKANGYVLRVWANFVRNPQLIFDVPHSVSMDANLSTIAQTLMDCFSFSEPILGAHSPSSRLLFAKDVAKLRPLSVDLFKRVKNSTSLGIDELRAEMVNMANDVSTCKGSSLALSELLSWVRGNGIRISQILQSSPESMEQRLPQKLSQVLNVCLETDNHIYSTISDYDMNN